MLWSSNDCDDDISYLYPIGFNFVYQGKTKANFGVSTNGRIRLFSPSNASPAMSSAFTNYLRTADTNYIMPFWEDLVIGTSTSGGIDSLTKYVRYKLLPGAPNRQLVIEWGKAGRYVSGLGAFGRFQFQVVLEENTNNIYFNYGQMQGFDFTQSTNLLMTPTIGMSSGVPLTDPLTSGMAFIQQAADQNLWGYYGFTSTVDVGNNKMQVLPDCQTQYVFDPSGTAPTLTAPTLPDAPDVSNKTDE
jgi:hypothetical protein